MSYKPITHLALIRPEPPPFPDCYRELTELGAEVREALIGGIIEHCLVPSPAAVVLMADSADHLHKVPPIIKALTASPVLALITPELLHATWPTVGVEDFMVGTGSGSELRARAIHLMRLHPESRHLIRHGDLAIDTASCEVSVGGRLIELTFKEYELLKFLAHEPGRVFSRQVLLDRVWGYDYFGGDRTVDVHIRRLRSKLEDANHTFIDTVRNIGYRLHRDK